TSLTAELTPWDVDQDGEIDTAVVTIWANEFDRSSAPACNSEEENHFRIELLDGIDDETWEEDADSISLGCMHKGTQTIRLWVIDEKGSFDYCDVVLIVQNNMGGCPDIDDTDRGRLLGNIATENGDMIEKVEVSATGENLAANMTTGADGLYDFQIPMGMVTTITPRKNIDHANGVSTMDLIILQKHIIGMELMGSPYKLIAADVNKDGFINALDLLEMRRLILGEISDFENSDSWRFLLKDYEFMTNEPQSELFPERLIISVDQPQMKRDFLGIKIGDLDLDSDPTKRAARSGKQLVFHTEDRELVKGQKISIPFVVNSTTLYEGFQFTINTATENVSVVDAFGNDALGFMRSNFGFTRSDDGMVTVSWHADRGQDLRGDQVFSIVLEVNENTMISDALSIDGKVTPAISFPEEGSAAGVAMNFTSGGIDYELDLFQNEPNPFVESTTIRFTLPKSSEAKLNIYDITGKHLKEIRGMFSKGLNQVALNANELTAKGLIYYELEVEGTKLIKKMIIQ
ncbi:MAG: T9SS type A sorting domain-containing protein, partial [Saprospiraceae bacterium]|nr:T9SS type A sorting domain-containing protein [Saprospiraceae bacterium]